MHPLKILGLIVCTFYTAMTFADHPSVKLAAPKDLDVATLKRLVPDLRKGGYIFYFRHAATEHSQQDRQPVILDDCTTQRNLSATGRGQARAIGKAFRLLGLPVGEVWSSPFCRCKETARLAFDKFQLDDDLYFAIGMSRAEKHQKGMTLRKRLSTLPTKGTNTVIVSHTANLQEAVDIWPKPEAVTILFQVTEENGFKAIGRIVPGVWQQIAGQ